MDRRQPSLGARFRKRARQAYVRLLKSPGAPREVAGGVALGLFVALLPLMGVQMPVAIVAAELLRRFFAIRLSRIAAAAGVWLTNPITAGPIYGVCYLAGLPFARWVLALGAGAAPGTAEAMVALGESAVAAEAAALEAVSSAAGPLGVEILLALLIGGVVIGIPVALLGYRIVHRLVSRYQARRAARRSRLSFAGAASATPEPT